MEQKTLLISLFDSVSVSEEIAEVTIVVITTITEDNLPFNAGEITKLRDVLRLSIGDHINELTDEDLISFGTSMLQATAAVLKAEYMRTKAPLK
jgi:hypothetical protein